MPKGVYKRKPRLKAEWQDVIKREPTAKARLIQHVQGHVLSIFPTLDMRQAHILMHCVGIGMSEIVVVDGKVVTYDEWEAIIRQLIRK